METFLACAHTFREYAKVRFLPHMHGTTPPTPTNMSAMFGTLPLDTFQQPMFWSNAAASRRMAKMSGENVGKVDVV